jgi:hypothetical protein
MKNQHDQNTLWVMVGYIFRYAVLAMLTIARMGCLSQKNMLPMDWCFNTQVLPC